MTHETTNNSEKVTLKVNVRVNLDQYRPYLKEAEEVIDRIRFAGLFDEFESWVVGPHPDGIDEVALTNWLISSKEDIYANLGLSVNLAQLTGAILKELAAEFGDIAIREYTGKRFQDSDIALLIESLFRHGYFLPEAVSRIRRLFVSGWPHSYRAVAYPDNKVIYYRLYPADWNDERPPQYALYRYEEEGRENLRHALIRPDERCNMRKFQTNRLHEVWVHNRAGS